jgi:predicted SprT family Zn-dependent metalloprotease
MKQNPYTPFRALEVQCTSCGYNVKSPKVTMADRFAKGKFLCKKCKKKLKKGKKKWLEKKSKN